MLPTLEGYGYRMVPCFLTPSLPATIISPDKVGRFFRCRGYTSISNFNGVGCQLRLHHCRRISEDITVPLVLDRGLLYSEPLIRPTTDADRLGPMPTPVLHVQKVDKVDNLSSNDDVSISSDSTAPTRNCCSGCVDGGTCARVPPTAPSDDNGVPVVETVEEDEDDDASQSSYSELPFDCNCCRVASPAEPPPSSDVAEKLLLFQRLGLQYDVPLEDLHQYADGVPSWSSDCPPLCGHCSSDDGSVSSEESSTDRNDDLHQFDYSRVYGTWTRICDSTPYSRSTSDSLASTVWSLAFTACLQDA